MTETEQKVFNYPMRFPFFLLVDDKFKKLSPHAKILYGYIYHNLTMEVCTFKREDENGDEYLELGLKQICEVLNCRTERATKTKRELAEYGLIEEKKQIKKCNSIYAFYPTDIYTDENYEKLLKIL